jgi:DNA-binding transcriptional regulator YiaG
MSNERHEYFIKGQALLPQPFHYAMCGLPNVYLLNGVLFHESDGYGPSYEVEDIDGLHDTIAAHIVERTNDLLTGPELRFLRKRMKKTQADFAHLLRVTEQTIANYEKGATAISGPADFAVRMHYLLHVLPPDAGRAMIDELASLTSQAQEAKTPFVPRRTTAAWDESCVAA